MKVKRVHVEPRFIAQVLTEGYRLKGVLEISAGLPEGCELVAIFWDELYRKYALDFSHESFPCVELNNGVPIIEIYVTLRPAVLADALSA